MTLDSVIVLSPVDWIARGVAAGDAGNLQRQPATLLHLFLRCRVQETLFSLSLLLPPCSSASKAKHWIKPATVQLHAVFGGQRSSFRPPTSCCMDSGADRCAASWGPEHEQHLERVKRVPCLCAQGSEVCCDRQRGHAQPRLVLGPDPLRRVLGPPCYPYHGELRTKQGQSKTAF